LYSLIVDNIPGLVTSRPGNATIEILETDQYGRTLFTYRGDASRYDGYADTLYIYAICQQVKDKNVYYYEDYFYILADSADSFYSEDINELKKINDWQLPIDESKMAILHESSASVSSKVKEIFDSKHNPTNSEINIDFIGEDKNGESAYFISAFRTEEKNANKNEIIFDGNYLMILDKEGEYDKNNYLIRIDDIYNYQPELHELKIKNGWQF
ncbi:MAG: hypothetical protein RR500_10030, partial [Bacilli bacterium]